MKRFGDCLQKGVLPNETYKEWVKESQSSDPEAKWHPRPRGTKRYVVRNGKLVEIHAGR